MKIKLTICYDGTSFVGWQRQSKGVSVQETVETALKTITGKDIKIVGSGRTDAGVHAEGQVASFTAENNILPEKYALALNTVLPKEVKILKSERVLDDFDACRKAKRKTYRYSMYISDIDNPLLDRYNTRIFNHPKIDFELIKETAKLFVGTHDFKAFCASGSSVKTTERTIYSFNVKIVKDKMTFTVTGNGFLYNMVRIMSGVLVMVGKGEMTKSEVIAMLNSGIRPMKVKTLPAKGLCLVKVSYNK